MGRKVMIASVKHLSVLGNSHYKSQISQKEYKYFQITKHMRKLPIPQRLQNQLAVNTLTYFQCECGKSYEAFPALYLHFQRKHNIRISKNFSQENCMIQDKLDYKIVTYYFTDKEENQKHEKLRKSYWGNLISEYLKTNISDENDKKQSVDCLDNLRKYIENMNIDLVNLFQGEMKEEMAYHFNFFMLQKADQLPMNEFASWSQALISFSEWQFKNGHSKIMLEKNEKFLA